MPYVTYMQQSSTTNLNLPQVLLRLLVQCSIIELVPNSLQGVAQAVQPGVELA